MSRSTAGERDPVPASRSASGHWRGAALLVVTVTLLAGCATVDSRPSPARVATPGPTPLPDPSAATDRPTPTAEPTSAGAVYLALGDSITFGIGVPQPQRNGYVARVADALADAVPPIDETRVFAVPGETATGFLDRRLDDVVRAIDELGPRVGLVTIGLGANELLRTRREPACADRASDACAALVGTATAEAAASLHAIVAGVQSALAASGASDARVLLLAYYNPEAGDLVATSVAGADDVVGCDPQDPEPGLDDRIACVAEARGVELVDLYAAFLGREQELTRIARGDVHPNAAGYQLIADTILATLAPP